MEPRKIIQFGNSSFVVTLPLEWVKKNELDKGDSISLIETDQSIIISPQKEKEEKMATISLDNMPMKIFNKELISYYLKNYKTIKVTCKNCIDRIEEIRVLKEKLSSVEITEIHKDYVILQDLISPSELDVNKLLKEIVEMEKILFAELTKGEGNDKHFLVNNLDTNINKLTFLGYKAINYNLDSWSNPDDVKKSIHHRRFISAFEETGDILKRITRYIKDDSKPYMPKLYATISNIESYYTFITSLIDLDSNLDNNLKLYLDKKQSLLREFEELREDFGDDVNLFLVITQLFRDIIGQLERVLLSIIDLKCN